jgi:hypothetical protein
MVNLHGSLGCWTTGTYGLGLGSSPLSDGIVSMRVEVVGYVEEDRR